MADIKSPEERSINMSHIRSKNTEPELCFRRWLFARGYRYSLNNKKIPGHPDLWMPKYNTAVFIHGCFWHRHEGCKYAYMPKTREEFWRNKFNKNRQRDLKVSLELVEMGIKQLIVWECTIKKMKTDKSFCDECLESIEVFLEDTCQRFEL